MAFKLELSQPKVLEQTFHFDIPTFISEILISSVRRKVRRGRQKQFQEEEEYNMCMIFQGYYIKIYKYFVNLYQI